MRRRQLVAVATTKMEFHIVKIILTILTTIFALVAWCGQATAQEGDNTPTLSPVELFTCNYLKNKDRGDLDKVIARWNAWTDANDPVPYTAWVMTPAYYGQEITFDVAWIGGWPTNADMGKSQQTWMEEGGKMNAEFSKVLSCDQHALMMALPMQPPGEPPKSSLVRFMDCEVAEGKRPLEAVEAHMKLKKYMQGKGSQTSAWVFFPAWGAGKIEYDYKLVLGDADYPTLTKDTEIIANGGGWQEAAKTIGSVARCDSARVYHADLVRNGMAK